MPSSRWCTTIRYRPAGRPLRLVPRRRSSVSSSSDSSSAVPSTSTLPSSPASTYWHRLPRPRRRVPEPPLPLRPPVPAAVPRAGLAASCCDPGRPAAAGASSASSPSASAGRGRPEPRRSRARAGCRRWGLAAALVAGRRCRRSSACRRRSGRPASSRAVRRCPRSVRPRSAASSVQSSPPTRSAVVARRRRRRRRHRGPLGRRRRWRPRRPRRRRPASSAVAPAARSAPALLLRPGRPGRRSHAPAFESSVPVSVGAGVGVARRRPASVPPASVRLTWSPSRVRSGGCARSSCPTRRGRATRPLMPSLMTRALRRARARVGIRRLLPCAVALDPLMRTQRAALDEFVGDA